MIPLGDQLRQILQPRLDMVVERVGTPLAEQIEQAMRRNTEQGHGFTSDPYDSTYSDGHARVRRKKGLQTAKVDLRMDKRRIDNTYIRKVGVVGAGSPGVQIGIQDAQGSTIMRLHHDGRAKGGKTRSIFPKEPRSIPAEYVEQAKRTLTELLRGQ